MAGAQNTYHLEHVVIFGAENCHSTQLFGNPPTGPGIKLLGGSEGNKHAVALKAAAHK